MINQENFRILGDWGLQSKQLQLIYNKLTDTDLEFETGEEASLLDRISNRLNIDTNAAMRIIVENFLKSFDSPNY